MVRTTGFEISGIFGYAAGLRCPISSLPTKRQRQLSTAATRSAPLPPPPAAVASLPQSKYLALVSRCRRLQSLMQRKRSRFRKSGFWIFGPDDRIRTCGIFGYAAGLRCPIKSSHLTHFLDFIDRYTKMLVLHLPLAADKHFAQSKRLTLLASCRRFNQAAEKTQRELPTRGSSLCVVRTTGFEPAASCSQSKRSTKLSHVRILIKL